MFTVFGRGEIEMGLKCAWNLIFSLGEKQMEGTINNGGNVSFLVHPTAKPSPEEGRKFGHIIEWIYNFSYCFGLFSILTGENFQ
jgi:hypothetical protein